MAAVVGNQSTYWGKDTDAVKDSVKYTRYISSMKMSQIFSRTTVVLTHAGVGAGIGAAVGAGAGGIGAGPGAGIGAGIGAGVGALNASIYDCCKYVAYKRSLSKEARESLDECFNKYADGQDSICPISGCVPVVPVRIPGEPQIYEKSELEKAHKRNGISPLTRRPFNKADIEFAIDGVARSAKICDMILNDQAEKSNFTEEQIKGIKILRKESVAVAQDYFEKESGSLMGNVRRHKITPRDAAAQFFKLAEVLDPALGDQAVEARTKSERSESIKGFSALPGSDDEEKV